MYFGRYEPRCQKCVFYGLGIVRPGTVPGRDRPGTRKFFFWNRLPDHPRTQKCEFCWNIMYSRGLGYKDMAQWKMTIPARKNRSLLNFTKPVIEIAWMYAVSSASPAGLFLNGVRRLFLQQVLYNGAKTGFSGREPHFSLWHFVVFKNT